MPLYETDVLRGSASSRWALLWLSLILALATFLRLWQAGESLWIDELHTSWVVSGKLSDVLPRAAMGNQSPLYFWGLWLLVQVTGQSEWTLRLPSLVAGIALPAAVYAFVGQVFNLSKPNSGQIGNLSYAGLAAALLVAIDPTCIFYAQEARPYAWVMLLAVVELALLRRLIERPTVRWRMALMAISLALFYLHYTTAIFLAGIVVLLPMVVRLTRSPYPAKYLVLDLLLTAALAAPGVVQMSDIFERRTNWAAFVDKPSLQELFTGVPFALWAMLGALFVALVCLVPRVLPGNALTRGSASAVPSKSRPAPNVVWYCVLLTATLLPLILSWGVTALDAARVYHVRYLVALIPLAIAATCLTTAWIPSRITQTAALVALAAWHLYDGRMLEQFARDGRLVAMRNEDWRGAINYLNNRLAEDRSAIVILYPDLIELKGVITDDVEQQYGMFATSGIYRVDSRHLHLWCTWKGINSEVELISDWQVSRNRKAWYVVRNDAASADDLVQSLRLMSPLFRESKPIRARVADYQTFGRIRLVLMAPDRAM